MILEVLTVKDKEGNLCLKFSKALLKNLDWKEGDVLEFTDEADGSIFIRKKFNSDEFKAGLC